MKKWEDMNDIEQIYMYWEYLAAEDIEDDNFTFKEFDDLMRSISEE